MSITKDLQQISAIIYVRVLYKIAQKEILSLKFFNVCVPCSSCEGQQSHLVEQFIARKADILFCPAWRTATPQDDEYEEEDDTGACA